MTVTDIPMHAIEVSDDRARTDMGDVEELAASIAAVGQLQPIVVRPLGDGYELLAGERRYRAQQFLGAMMIQATVREVSDDEALVVEAVENGARKSFAPSEAAWLGLQLEKRAEADPTLLGKLPSGSRNRERFALAVGMSDGTYHKVRAMVAQQKELAGDRDALKTWKVLDRLIEQMDASGKVDGPYRQFRALRQLHDLAVVTDDEAGTMAAEVIARAVDEPGIDLTLEVEGLASYLEVDQVPAGDDVADPTPAAAEVDEHDVAQGGSDVSTPEASEPTPAWKDLSGAQREAMANLWRAGELRYSNATTETTVYHLVADHLAERGLVTIGPGAGATLDGQVVELTDLGADVMCRFAEEWWPAQRGALSGLASDWQLVEDYAPPSPWEEAGVVFERNGGAKYRVLIIDGSSATLSPVLDSLEVAEDWLEERGFETPTRPQGDSPDVASESTPGISPSLIPDGWGIASMWPTTGAWTILFELEGPDDRAPRYRYWLGGPWGSHTGTGASSGPVVDDENAAVEGLLDVCWPGWRDLPTVPKCPPGNQRAINAWAAKAAEVLPDGWLDQDFPPILTERGSIGTRHHVDLYSGTIDCCAEVARLAPAPVDSPDGSESPAPSAGVNEPTTHLEGDELVPDPSTEVEGEVPDTDPATVSAADEEPEFRRSGSSSPNLPKREKPNPVRTDECVAVIGAVRDLCDEIMRHVPAVTTEDVMRYLATKGPDGGTVGDELRDDLADVVPFLTDLRVLTIKPPG